MGRMTHRVMGLAVRAVPSIMIAGSLMFTAPGYAASGRATATLKTKDGAAAGTVEILPSPAGAFLRVKLLGLAPGGHGIKVHEVGTCEGDFASSGAILNPLGSGQGLLNETGPAAGDLPNVFVSASGDGEAEIITPLLQPGADEGDLLFDDDGASIVVYDKVDDHLGVAEGIAGTRVACGVLERKP